MVPGTGGVSLGKESSKGLNTESNNPQRASATVLAELAAGRHCREEHTMFTQVQGPLGEVKPLRPALVYCTAWRVYSTGELRELKVANNGYGYGYGARASLCPSSVLVLILFRPFCPDVPLPLI